MRSKPLTKREKKMTEYTFKVNLDGITELDCFREATKDELKILLAIKSLEDTLFSAESLADSLGVSAARIKAAITLFEESSVLVASEGGILADVEYEFEPRKEKTTENKIETAKSLRDNHLQDLILDMENVLEKTLCARETERINSLYTEKDLSAEYILTLASFLKTRRDPLTVEAIVREANKLVEKGKSSLEELEIYVREKEAEIKGEMEMRRLLGIHSRAITPSERTFFKRWLHEFGYSSVIIGEAYDITVNATGKLSLAYIDSILTGWHEAGCKTLEECRARVNIRKQERTKKGNNSSQKSKKTVEAETPKYADFNSEDALMKALERSYGEK